MLVGRRRRERTQQARAGREHQLGGGHAGQQGDLGVEVLDRQRAAVGEPVAAVAGDHLLLGDGEADGAARALALDQQRADLGEQREPLVGARVQRPLGARVVQLLAAADEGAADVEAGPLAVAVEVDRPQHRRPVPGGQQARGALGEQRRVQRCLGVGQVAGEHAGVGLGVERAAGRDEGRDVGDGVVDAVAAVAPLERDRLVEVHRAGGIEREERDRPAVLGGQCGRLGGRLGLGEHRRCERPGNVELAPDRREARAQDAGLVGDTDQAAHGRGPYVTRAGGL